MTRCDLMLELRNILIDVGLPPRERRGEIAFKIG
jgi:hypothetical protein